MPPQLPRTQKLDLRISPEAKEALVRAAALEQRSLSDFVVQSALTRAEEALADRQRFVLSDEAYDTFVAELDRPPRENSKLKQILAKQSPFEDL